jgi:hypothetical protein
MSNIVTKKERRGTTYSRGRGQNTRLRGGEGWSTCQGGGDHKRGHKRRTQEVAQLFWKWRGASHYGCNYKTKAGMTYSTGRFALKVERESDASDHVRDCKQCGYDIRQRLEKPTVGRAEGEVSGHCKMSAETTYGRLRVEEG